MSKVTARGYVNGYERKTSAGGNEYAKFTLAVKQKRKDKSGQFIHEKIYYDCVDFSGKEPPGLQEGQYGLTAYVGLTGYLTVTPWCKGGKGGANLNVTVIEYEELEQREPAGAKRGAEPPDDPFAFEEGK